MLKFIYNKFKLLKPKAQNSLATGSLYKFMGGSTVLYNHPNFSIFYNHKNIIKLLQPGEIILFLETRSFEESTSKWSKILMDNKIGWIFNSHACSFYKNKPKMIDNFILLDRENNEI